jgi:hypothetical protein
MQNRGLFIAVRKRIFKKKIRQWSQFCLVVELRTFAEPVQRTPLQKGA